MILDTSCTCRGVLGLIGAPCPLHAHDPAIHVPKDRLEPDRCRERDGRDARCALVAWHGQNGTACLFPPNAAQEVR